MPGACTGMVISTESPTSGLLTSAASKRILANFSLRFALVLEGEHAGDVFVGDLLELVRVLLPAERALEGAGESDGCAVADALADDGAHLELVAAADESAAARALS